MTAEVTLQLAVFAASPPPLPPTVRHRATSLICEVIAAASAGWSTGTAAATFSLIDSLRVPARATVLGRNIRVSTASAALLNGIAAYGDRSPTYKVAVPVVAAALAAAEREGKSGGVFLEAVVVGIESALRLSLGFGQSHDTLGWHAAGTLGHLGAAAATGRVLGLDATGIRDALGIAALEAAGFTSAIGTPAESYQAGKAAFDGVEAGFMARLGIASSPRSIEGRRGLAILVSEEPDFEAIVAELGSDWVLSACGDDRESDIGAALRRTAEALETHASVGPLIAAAPRTS